MFVGRIFIGLVEPGETRQQPCTLDPKVTKAGRSGIRVTDFEPVNSYAGSEPLKPEFSGLAVRDVSDAPTAGPSDAALGYAWEPSPQYMARNTEAEILNKERAGERAPGARPPFLFYTEETGMSAARAVVAPAAKADVSRDQHLWELYRAPDIAPRLRPVDEHLLRPYRPFLPARYRRLFSNPRNAAVALLASAILLAAGTALWINRSEQAVVTAQQLALAGRQQLTEAVRHARQFGVSETLLRPVQLSAKRLARDRVPAASLFATDQRAFFVEHARRYAALRKELDRLRQRALEYWAWREGLAYGQLVQTLGRSATASKSHSATLAVCPSARCYQGAVRKQSAQIPLLTKKSP